MPPASRRGSTARGLATLFRAAATPGQSYRRFDWQTAEDERHDDLLAGLAAPREVFPLIARWLAERSGR